MTEASETVFNNIRSFVQKEVNRVISEHLEKKNYNVNEAQLWTNHICDDVNGREYADFESDHQCEQELQIHNQLHHHAESRLRPEPVRLVLLG